MWRSFNFTPNLADLAHLKCVCYIFRSCVSLCLGVSCPGKWRRGLSWRSKGVAGGNFCHLSLYHIRMVPHHLLGQISEATHKHTHTPHLPAQTHAHKPWGKRWNILLISLTLRPGDPDLKTMTIHRDRMTLGYRCIPITHDCTHKHKHTRWS